MKYITIDGDDIGQRITSYYLSNDVTSLKEFNDLMNETTQAIANYLESIGFVIIFCAADGVAGFAEEHVIFNHIDVFNEITKISAKCATFSAGIGKSLRESYIALVSAKSCGKSRIHQYSDLK